MYFFTSGRNANTNEIFVYFEAALQKIQAGFQVSDRELVILVNEKDEELGTSEKLEVHRKGQLHRALSVVIVDRSGNMLLQQRAAHKYHSPGLWSNTCCSHPRPGEKTPDAAQRRLMEEMGLQVVLQHCDEFIYKVELEKGLMEYEYDHVFLGESNQDPILNPGEVMSYRWMNLNELIADIKAHPEKYTYWFPLLLQRLFDKKLLRV